MRVWSSPHTPPARKYAHGLTEPSELTAGMNRRVENNGSPLRDGAIEALTVGLSRSERDTFLSQYYRLLGPLGQFIRAEPATVRRRVS